jgi:hypothetical protein
MVKMPWDGTSFWWNKHHGAWSIVQHFRRRAAQHFPSLGATVLAHDDRERVYCTGDLRNFGGWGTNTYVDGKPVEYRSPGSQVIAQLLCWQLAFADVQNVESGSLDIGEHFCDGQRRQCLFCAVEWNEDDWFAHASFALTRAPPSGSVSSCH